MSNVKTADELRAWLLEWIGKELDMQASEIDPERSLLDYSMSSVTATILVGDLEDWLDLQLSPTLVWDYTSINAITEHLLGEMAGGAAGGGSASAETKDAAALLENLDDLSEEEIDALLGQLENA